MGKILVLENYPAILMGNILRLENYPAILMGNILILKNCPAILMGNILVLKNYPAILLGNILSLKCSTFKLEHITSYDSNAGWQFWQMAISFFSIYLELTDFLRIFAGDN